MTELKALIFDVDGTLADTEKDGHRVAFNQAFQSAGLDWNWSIQQYGELLETTGGKERILHYVQTCHPQLYSHASLTNLIEKIHQLKSHYYGEVLKSGVVSLRPGIRRLFIEAKSAGIQLAIATTSSHANTLSLLENLIGIESPSWFTVIGSGDRVTLKKPAPDVYRYVLEKLGLPATACLAIEDSHHGLKSSLAAGLPTVITVSTYTQLQDFNGALVVLDHLGDPGNPCQILSQSFNDSLHGRGGTSLVFPWINVAQLRHLRELTNEPLEFLVPP